MKLKLATMLLLFTVMVFSQEKTFSEQELTINQHIDGTLLLPLGVESPSLAIIIPDSGPVDRNGNQNLLRNNSLKKLAVALGNKGIATFRYDKRIVKQIRRRNVDSQMRFDDFITDAISILSFFKDKDGFNKIYIIGHGQGSLVGLVAAKEGADGFISISGAGKSIDLVIEEQINSTAPMFLEDAQRVFSILKEGKTTTDYPQALASIFSMDVQPFMASWMSYDPQQEIKSLSIPVLIINGTKDLQVSVEEATLLKSAAEGAQLEIIEKMNHIFVPIEGDDLINSKSYNESRRAIAPELIEKIIAFIK